MVQELEIFKEYLPPSMCHMTHFTCHMSIFMCNMSYMDKVVNLVNGGSVINRAYPFKCLNGTPTPQNQNFLERTELKNLDVSFSKAKIRTEFPKLDYMFLQNKTNKQKKYLQLVDLEIFQ